MTIVYITLLTIVAGGIGTLTGFGTSTIMVPVLLLFLPLPQTLLLVGIVHWFGDVWKILLFKSGLNWKLILAFGLAGIAASYLGAQVVFAAPERLLSRILGGFLLAYVLFLLFKPAFKISGRTATAITGGALSGFLAGIFGVGGAVRSAFLTVFDCKPPAVESLPMNQPCSSCRLCGSPHIEPIGVAAGRDLLLCRDCDMVFVPATQHLTPKRERERYAQHDNTADNPGYVSYLEGVARILDDIPVDNPSVLDFGCGEEAVLAGILREKGVRCAAYDPLYWIGGDALSGEYDVVIACEVIEHLRDLGSELSLLGRLVRSGGYLVIRTQLRPEDPAAVSRWWYAQDLTHINFFSERCMRWVASRIGMHLRSVSVQGTIVLERPLVQ